MQAELFARPNDLPDGFVYRPELLTRAEEAALLAAIEPLPFREFEFHGFLGKRRVVSFGWRYDYSQGALQSAAPIPDFLHPARQKAAGLAGRRPDDFVQALITHYPAGSTIGWHRDRSVFDEVAGLSLLAPCTFRLRQKDGDTWRRKSLMLEPRSGYILRGEVREDWEHSIPALEQPRYSITFRTLRQS